MKRGKLATTEEVRNSRSLPKHGQGYNVDRNNIYIYI